MKFGLRGLGLSAALMAVSPVAMAHQLECEKTVNGKSYIEVDYYPTTLNYEVTIKNTHPESPSEVMEASDPMMEDLGYAGFYTPQTIPWKDKISKSYEVEVKSYEECRYLSKLDGKDDDYIENTFYIRWDSGSSVCEAAVKCVPPKHEEEEEGRMTGGGSVFGKGKKRVTHGFQLRCDADDPRQNLEVNWQGNRFHLLELTSATCTDDPALDEEQPVAGFNTFTGTGTGRYNGEEGATIEFIFTDDGEPGKDDRARILIRNKNGAVVLDVDGTLQFGNHQAHP